MPLDTEEDKTIEINAKVANIGIAARASTKMAI